MKVILQVDIENVGSMGDMVNVADGYGRNYLIPRNMAIAATKKNIKLVEAQRRELQKKKERLLDSLQKVADRIQELTLHFERQASASGRLFGSVTSANIQEALQANGIEVERRQVLLGASLKELGEHKVPVRLHQELTTRVRLQITGVDVPEGEEPEVDPEEVENAEASAQVPNGFMVREVGPVEEEEVQASAPAARPRVEVVAEPEAEPEEESVEEPEERQE